MNISGSPREIDKVRSAQPRQASVDSIEETVSRDVVSELYQLLLERPQESLCDIEMRGIRWQEEKV